MYFNCAIYITYEQQPLSVAIGQIKQILSMSWLHIVTSFAMSNDRDLTLFCVKTVCEYRQRASVYQSA